MVTFPGRGRRSARLRSMTQGSRAMTTAGPFSWLYAMASLRRPMNSGRRLGTPTLQNPTPQARAGAPHAPGPARAHAAHRLPGEPVGLVKPRGLAHRGPHAQNRVASSEIQSQRVASDVARVDPFRGRLLDGVEARPVGTAGAKGRAPPSALRDLRVRGLPVDPGELREDSLHDLGQKLSRVRDRAGELPPHSAAVEELRLDDAGRLLEYEDLLVGVQEVEDEIRMQRVGLHDMVKGDAVPQAGLREDLPGVGRRDAGSHYRPRAGGVRARTARRGPRAAGGGGGLFGGPPVQLVAERGSGGPAGGGVPGGGPPGERGG